MTTKGVNTSLHLQLKLCLQIWTTCYESFRHQRKIDRLPDNRMPMIIVWKKTACICMHTACTVS